MRSGDTICLSPKDEIRLEEIRTNMHFENECYLSIGGYNLEPGQTRIVGTFLKASMGNHQFEALVKKDHMILGKILVNLEQVSQ
jgi:hypothetical protein